MKLYDGRGKRFKKLIDPYVIMKENRLKLSEVMPKHARAKWYSIWIRSFLVTVLGTWIFLALSDAMGVYVNGQSLIADDYIFFIFLTAFTGIITASLATVSLRRRTWKSKGIAIRTLVELEFCPNCGYIIRDTPADSDGCTPCAECGHAWRVEPVES